MTGIRKRSTDPRVDQKKMTRYGTSEAQEIKDSNDAMEPMLEARRRYEAAKRKRR